MSSKDPELLSETCQYVTGANMALLFMVVFNDLVGNRVLAWQNHSVLGAERDRGSIKASSDADNAIVERRAQFT